MEKNFAPKTEPEGELRYSEIPSAPELEPEKEALEQGARPESSGTEGQEQASYGLPSPKKKAALPPPARDRLTIKVEKLLESGLEDAYQALSPLAQQEFKLKGEQTASKIRELMRSAKIKVKKIFKLIFEWLSMLPGINHFFLEQEAKIKTDKIIELKKQEEEKNYV